MCENLNAEISIGTIGSLVDAVGYLMWTFFARRVRGNPSYYGAESDKDDDVEDFLLGVVKDTIGKLKEHGCVEVEAGEENDRAVTPTVLGTTASNYYLDYRTPKQMMFGVQQARKIIDSLLTEEEEKDNETKMGKVQSEPPVVSAADGIKLEPFVRSARVDEVSLAWLLYTVSITHEFDELPVRHNEEHLNADLSEDVMWGADTTSLLNPSGGGSEYVNMDLMADPHTKCFLLLQAHLEGTRLPISDYINDTRTVVDQVPRLLAAMHFVALDDKTISGNLELLSQFSRARALLAMKAMADDDPLCQLQGFTTDVIRRMSNGARAAKQLMPTLFGLRSQTRDTTQATLLRLLKGRKSVDNLLNSLYGVPLYRIANFSISHAVDKATRKAKGTLHLEIEVSYEKINNNNSGGGGGKNRRGGRNNNHNNNNNDDDRPMTLTVLLGTRVRKALLGHASCGVSRRGDPLSPTKKKVQIEFDWASANADGGQDGGAVVLRLLLEDMRGMDTHTVIPLSSS